MYTFAVGTFASRDHQSVFNIVSLLRFIPPISSKEKEIRKTIDAIRLDFDANFYTSAYPDVAAGRLDPIRHYVLFGWREGRDPSAVFSTNKYLTNNPNVANADVNPLWHYHAVGKNSGCKAYPSDLWADRRQVGKFAADVGAAFDPEYYRSVYPDIAENDINPLEHYVLAGWREGRDPSPEFSTLYYLAKYEDVAESGENPLWHYVLKGRAEQRTATPQSPADWEALTEAHDGLRVIQPHFDAAFYLETNPDIAAMNANPLVHFMFVGWREGRDPSASFSTAHYLADNPDVAEMSINPLLHYVQVGRQEGRSSTHPSGYKAKLLMANEPFERLVDHWKSKAPTEPKKMLCRNEIVKILRELATKNSKLIVSVGHDNFLDVGGGVQLCIQREAEVAGRYDAAYLNIHPFRPLPCLANPEDEDYLINVAANGRVWGCVGIDAFIDSIKQSRTEFQKLDLVIHHLLGHSPERLLDLFRAGNLERCVFWVHDFFAICPNHSLQRNNIAFCGAPSPNSNACSICLYGPERRSHSKRIRRFFEAVDVTLFCPSEAAAGFWRSRLDLPLDRLVVQEHLTLSQTGQAKSARPFQPFATIAYVGYIAPHKGWPAFEMLVRNYREDPQFRFLYFGVQRPPIEGVRQINARVTAENPTAMSDALSMNSVDCVLHWANCFETFSFSTYEAFAGGSYVLTNPSSGNVASAVEQTGWGAVLKDEEELLDFFSDGRLEDLAHQARRQRARTKISLAMSDMTLPILYSGAQP